MKTATHEFDYPQVITYNYTWHTYTTDHNMIRADVYCETLTNGEVSDVYTAYSHEFSNTRAGAKLAGCFGHRMAALGSFQRDRDLARVSS